MTEITAWQMFFMGGPLMWPIFFSSVFVLSVTIDKALLFSSLDKDTRPLKENVFSEVRKNNIKGAMAVCDGSRSLCARLFKLGLIKFGGSKEEIIQSMDEAAVSVIVGLERSLPAIAMIAQVAPLLGLLGTVLGLGSAFHVVQIHAQALNPLMVSDIAAGVWQSLVVTVAGLVVGVMATIAYNYFCTRLNLTVREMERNAADLANFMTRISDGTEPGARG